MSKMRTLYALVRFVLRLSRPVPSGARPARKPCSGAAWLALTLCVAVSATNAQMIKEHIDAEAVAVVAQIHPTCEPADGPCFEPFEPGSPFGGGAGSAAEAPGVPSCRGDCRG